MRWLRLVGLRLRAAVLLAVQYRWDFFIDGAISLLWAATAVTPLFVVYGSGRSEAGIPGWSFGETLVVTGWFIVLQGILEGAINPGLQAVVDHIRKGTLDFVLLKPADAQFLVSTSRFQLFRVFSLFSGLAIFAIAFERLGRWPSVGNVALSLVLLLASTVVLYSLWILIVSAAFFVVKVDNLTYLFSSIFDAARWPATVFPGALRFVFTFIIPLAVMTTFPAEALLDRLERSSLIASVVGAAVFSLAARWVWLQSIRRYTSAGG